LNDNDAQVETAAPRGGLDVRIAQDLVEQARAEGLALTGPDGLLAAITKNVIQVALEAEMTEHLGFEKGDRAAAAAAGGGNHRNGTSKKTVQTGVGPSSSTSRATGPAGSNPASFRNTPGGSAGSTRGL
jgi:putative transposase